MNSAKLLNNRFWSNQMKNVMHIFLDEYGMFMKYIVEILLNERDIDVASELYRYEKNKIIVPKYVISNTIYDYDENNQLKNVDFTSCQQIVDDMKICSVYRLGVVQKALLNEHYPLVKALIY